MADTDDARRLAEIRARADAASPGPWQIEGVRVTATRASGTMTADLVASNAAFVAFARDDIPYLLDLVAARDKELTELRGLLADLCEDSRAAAAALRYWQSLEKVAYQHELPYPTWRDTADAMLTFARAALGGETR